MLKPVAVIAGSLATVAGWLTLVLTADDGSLQRSVAISPLTLLEQWPALGAMVGVTGVVTAAPVRIWRMRPNEALGVLAGNVAANLSAAFLVVPALVGELEPHHGTTILAVITGLGLTPLVATIVAVGAAVRIKRSPVSLRG